MSVETMGYSRSSSTDRSAAAKELWELLIPSSPPPRQIYEKAQTNRTLNHPSLPQPSVEDEERKKEESLKVLSRSDKLEKRLEACLRNSMSSTMITSYDDISPTSTLDFPGASQYSSQGNMSLPWKNPHASHKSDGDDLSDLKSRLRNALSSASCARIRGGSEKDDASPNSTLNFPGAKSSPSLSCRWTAKSKLDCDFFMDNEVYQEDYRDDAGLLFDEDPLDCYQSNNIDDERINKPHSSAYTLREHLGMPPLKPHQSTHTQTMNMRKANSSLPFNQETQTTTTTTTTTRTTAPPNRCSEINRHSAKHTFVVCADTQIGMTSQNAEWETELEYSRQAIRKINSLHPKPAFVCMCGDLVDMEHTFHKGPDAMFTKTQCIEIQDQQNRDFKETWKGLHEDIALVCLCGNHDVGNHPTKQSIDRFRSAFGDEYLAFWTNGTYNIVLNNVLFHDPTGAPDIFDQQLLWLEERLRYARDCGADHIFVFGHHPWFLYDEDETEDDLKGGSPYPQEWGGSSSSKVFLDRYFSINKKYRDIAFDLFKEFKVSAAFSGHFHQSLASTTSWGMDMIVTGPLSMVFESTGKVGDEASEEIKGRGVRIVEVEEKGFCHHFLTL